MKRIVFLALLYFFISCKREKVEFLADAEVSLTVVNDRNEPVNYAQVLVFDNQDDYEQSISTSNIQKAVVNTTTNTKNGKDGVAFFKVSPNRSHYLLISYFDNLRNLRFTNNSDGNLINPLPVRTTAYLRIKVLPEDGNIIFYANANSKIPITISIVNNLNNTVEKYTLNQIYTGGLIPDVNSPNVLKVGKFQGNYSYYATSEDGCYWAGKVAVEKGKQAIVNFNNCQGNQIKFYASTINPTLFPLKVFLNNKEEIGSITSNTTAANCDIFKNGELKFYKDAGFYSYQVLSADNKCLWTGSFSINNGECKIISITGTCNED